MKLGYPCINNGLECRSSRTFRLKNYSKSRLIETIKGNLNCLQKILNYNKQHRLLFFRITSDLIPFGSHPIMDYNWQKHFHTTFEEIGQYIKENDMRITMHPGQYTVLNSNKEEVAKNAVKDLNYHVEILDLMRLDSTAKVQIHVGGVYDEKKKSLQRFIHRYKKLNENVQNRLIIENDDKSYSLKDCLEINKKIEIPVVFDVYHHECLNSGESIEDAFKKFTKTWKEKDGPPIIHYSSEHPTKGKCRHAEKIDLAHFKDFIHKTLPFDFDIMLEIKNKELSALQAIKVLEKDKRLKK